MTNLKVLVPLAAVAHCVFGGLSNEDIVRLIDEKPVGVYDQIPEQAGLPSTSSGFILLNYDDKVIDGIFGILGNSDYSSKWKAAFIDLRRISTVDPSAVGFDRLTEVVRRLEENPKIDEGRKVHILMSAYGAVARFSDDYSLEFIKKRIEPAFWESKQIERQIIHSDVSGADTKQTGQTQAILALAQMHTKEADAFLEQLLQDDTFTTVPHLDLALRTAEEYYKESDALTVNALRMEYQKRLELRGESETPMPPIPLAEVAVAEVSSVPSTLVEEPEPAIRELEELVQVKAVEPAQKAIEQPSQWWLWVFGLLMVVGGLAVVVRRKS